jgi:aminoglycoside phosphotransferase (APT) family kinase protein
LLLTTGHRSINKAVGLAFEPGVETPTKAVKFARVGEAEPGLEREAAVLGRLRETMPELPGVPLLLGRGSRSGRLAVVQEAVAGESLLGTLGPDNFEEVAMRMTRLLVELARGTQGRPDPDWRSRLVDEPLEWFHRHFGPALDDRHLSPDTGEKSVHASVTAALEGLGALSSTVEHRDCSPWNVLITPTGEPVLLDWESAEADGLPALDLFYFLANCAFVLDGALEDGRTRESYARLLDPTSEYGPVFQRAVTEYAAALELAPEDLTRLRLLCWIVHSRSDYRHLQLEAGGTPRQEDLRRGMFLGLVEEELR